MLRLSAVNNMYPDQQHLKFRVFLTVNQSRLPGPKFFFLFRFHMGLEKKESVDPKNRENVTPCSLDPVVSHILTFMTA